MRMLICSAALILPIVSGGCGRGDEQGAAGGTTIEIVENHSVELRNACASTTAYDRLKELLFAQAIRVRNADPVNMNKLARFSIVRMETPALRSRDDSLDTIVCGGRLVLEMPPGAERAFDGDRQLTAEVEYTAQPALDGSGYVYRLRGAEPIVDRLAAFDLKNAPLPRPAVEASLNEAVPDESQPPIASVPTPAPDPATPPAETPVQPAPPPAMRGLPAPPPPAPPPPAGG
jgi:hypothetical protein